MRIAASHARVLLLAAVIGLAGCSSVPSRQDIGTATGAVLGGVAGAALTGSRVVPVAGAAAGGVIGNQVGRELDRRR
jgi:osmotically inducible lipoprotein OsmB